MKADDLRQCSKCPNLYKVADEAEYREWNRLCLDCQDDVVKRYKAQRRAADSVYHPAVTVDRLSGPVSISWRDEAKNIIGNMADVPHPRSWVFDRFVKRPSYWADICEHCLQTHTGDCG